jgi:uncharacterized protein DUF4145
MNAGLSAHAQLASSRCRRCGHELIWWGEGVIHPSVLPVPDPNPDMPEDARQTYAEAGGIVDKSPRAAAALLRLAVEQLCAALGETGKLDASIKRLVAQGLPVEIQRALDYVRVVGNHAIHPGVIDISDDRPRALTLFALVNAITQQLITHRREVEELYTSLPDTVREAIAKRDATE